MSTSIVEFIYGPDTNLMMLRKPWSPASGTYPVDTTNGIVYLAQDSGTVGTTVYNTGDSIIRAAGTWQRLGSGFGGGGGSPINWTVIDDDYAVNGTEQILVNTTTFSVADPLEITLPTAPPINTVVTIAPLHPILVTSPILVIASDNISGQADDVLINQNNVVIDFIFVGGTIGWAVVNAGDTAIITTVIGGIHEVDYDPVASGSGTGPNIPLVSYVPTEAWYTTFLPAGAETQHTGPITGAGQFMYVDNVEPAYNSYFTNGTFSLPGSDDIQPAIVDTGSFYRPMTEVTGNRYVTFELANMTSLSHGAQGSIAMGMESVDSFAWSPTLGPGDDGTMGVFVDVKRVGGCYGGATSILYFAGDGTVGNSLITDPFLSTTWTPGVDAEFTINYNGSDHIVSIPSGTYTWETLVAEINSTMGISGLTAYYSTAEDNSWTQILFHTDNPNTVTISSLGNLSTVWDYMSGTFDSAEPVNYVIPYGTIVLQAGVYFYGDIVAVDAYACLQDPHSPSGTGKYNVITDLNDLPSKITCLITENLAYSRNELTIMFDGVPVNLYDYENSYNPAPYAPAPIYPTTQSYMSEVYFLYRTDNNYSTGFSTFGTLFAADPAADALGYVKVSSPTTNDPSDLSTVIAGGGSAPATIPITALSEGTLNHIVQDVTIGTTLYAAGTFLHRHGNTLLQVGGASGGGSFDPTANQSITGEWKFDISGNKSFAATNDVSGGDPTAQLGVHQIGATSKYIAGLVRNATGFGSGFLGTAIDTNGAGINMIVTESPGNTAVGSMGISIQEDNSTLIRLEANVIEVLQAPTTDLGIANKKYVDDATSSATAAAGSVIDFSASKIFNTRLLPSNAATFTNNFSGAKLGITQKIYHQNAAVPTFPANWQLVGANNYSAGVLNVIYAEWTGLIGPTDVAVEYWIVQG